MNTTEEKFKSLGLDQKALNIKNFIKNNSTNLDKADIKIKIDRYKSLKQKSIDENYNESKDLVDKSYVFSLKELENEKCKLILGFKVKKEDEVIKLTDEINQMKEMYL